MDNIYTANKMVPDNNANHEKQGSINGIRNSGGNPFNVRHTYRNVGKFCNSRVQRLDTVTK